MSEPWVDFHLHSTCSDGADPPQRVAERAAACGMAALALTDHDTLEGLPAARDAAEAHGLVFVPGVEISAGSGGHEVHILGLGVREDCPALNDTLSELAEGRATRAIAIAARLNELGVPVDIDRIMARTSGGTVGRMHLAQEVLGLGHAKSIQGAFDRYLKAGRPAFVEKPLLPVERAIAVIHEARGLAFVAHPGISRNNRVRLEKLLAGHTFDGIEAYHSKHSPGQTEEYLALARERGLLVTGGSDCHGAIKGGPPEMGKVRVPWSCWEKIRAALN